MAASLMYRTLEPRDKQCLRASLRKRALTVCASINAASHVTIRRCEFVFHNAAKSILLKALGASHATDSCRADKLAAGPWEPDTRYRDLLDIPLE